MHLLVPLLVAATAVCTIARPPGPSQLIATQDEQSRPPLPSTRGFLNEYYLPRLLMTQYLDYDTSMIAPQPDRDDWLNEEIYRITRMEEVADAIGLYENDLAQLLSNEPFLARMFDSPTNSHRNTYPRTARKPYIPVQTPSAFNPPAFVTSDKEPEKEENPILVQQDTDNRRKFALTPSDKGYFDSLPNKKEHPVTKTVDGHHEGGGEQLLVEIQPPRQIRQNPNLSKTKNLVAENLDQLRSGLVHEESGTTEKPRSIRLLEAATIDPADSIYGIAVIAAVGTALVLAIIGFAFGWYTMTKRAKAAADVDYPAYGVTGPTVDMTGDRKLAHSAHMYHYQHQKQQIIAMERNGMEQRNGSISEPESEEENEEGDYTVYECPGFATTGDMEVKNPLFSEEPTPATPGKCELVKPQPKD